jgi:hypothetical protein
MRDTVQAKLLQLGLLQRNASGAGWQLTQLARELLSATLSSSHESTLTKDLLELGMIAPAPNGSGMCWVFTPRGRMLLAYLLDRHSAYEEHGPDCGREH